jgi:hypothetical protein
MGARALLMFADFIASPFGPESSTPCFGSFHKQLILLKKSEAIFLE